jgi:hypothetical protein
MLNVVEKTLHTIAAHPFISGVVAVVIILGIYWIVFK